jgi:hypothetical protein
MRTIPSQAAVNRIFLSIVLLTGAVPFKGQHIPAPDDTKHGMLREAWLGLLPAQAGVAEQVAQQRCLDLPADQPDDRLQGPHGSSLISTSCEVVDYRVIVSGPTGRWARARYRWRSIFTAEDTSRGPAARDAVSEEEEVLFESRRAGQVRAVWHARYESDAAGVWRSITAELAPASQGTLVSVQSCVNGTGGCGQEFLLRHPDGRWFPVWQAWLDQLPSGFVGRVRHGVRIDPRTLRGDAGFYGSGDPNCCPSQRLLVTLALRGDSLVLIRQAVGPQ